jgi:hypothetical protein
MIEHVLDSLDMCQRGGCYDVSVKVETQDKIFSKMNSLEKDVVALVMKKLTESFNLSDLGKCGEDL